MLLPFSAKPHSPFFFPSHFLPPQNSKHIKFNIHTCSTTPSTSPQTITKTAIKRIAEKLQTLGHIQQHNTLQHAQVGNGIEGEIFLPFPQQLVSNRVGYTIIDDSSWTTPENPVPEPGSGFTISRFHELKKQVYMEKKGMVKRRERKVPTLAELKLSVEELKRLTTLGIGLKKKLNVGKPGITEGIVNGIHERWRRSEVVKIKCEDLCKMDMKRTHEILERKTGGLVVWRSGSTIILYRGASYEYPYFLTSVNQKNDTFNDKSFSESSMDHGVDGENPSSSAGTDVKYFPPNHLNRAVRSSLVHGVGSPNKVRFQLPGEAQLAEEADCLLDGLGPRFTDWWGYDPLPIDADLLPAIVPGYRRPFRLLPYGIKPKLTNDEMTTLRRLSRPLPCHFALGRNRRLQGLAVSMVKLWEKCEIAKVAIKRGVQNTNSDLMAEELKWLTGGTLLSRDREFITFYRGKDFLPAAVSTAIVERRKYVHKERQLTMKTLSFETRPEVETNSEQVPSEDGLQETIRRNIEHAAEQRKVKSANSRLKRISSKLSMALEKKENAEKLLADLEKISEPQQPGVDKEGISEEERYMLKKVGLRMKAYLPLGRRGVFDGTVENMHLHWKYRELVKILASGRSIEDVHEAARTLEAESGGILVAVERVNREYAIIVYRGKNYQRPVDLRPRTLLNKKQAMKRSIEAQRRESLKLHVLKLSNNIDQLKLQLVKDDMETSSSHLNEDTKEAYKSEIRDNGDLENSSNGKDASSVESNYDQESHPCVDASNCSEETVQQPKLMVSTKSLQEPDFRSKHSNILQSEVGDIAGSEATSSLVNSLTQDRVTCSVVDNAETCVSGNELIDSPLEFEKDKLDPAVRVDSEKATNVVAAYKAAALSNRDRLLLRKQALKMKKRPVLAIGRNNIVSGVAKTIKTHFQKHPLAIVNVKGRAEGTSIQEVIFMLEQATGAVLVSQETNKVILYRGWGMEQEQCGMNEKKNTKRTMTGREGSAQEVVSPQLMEAIRLECGLQSNKEVETL
ncbi:hypothetical protein IFM89_029474 [Coptis chinensis]|uniref:CRM domain-containing protein n=1 Tax=Coptis chinensis TaxID=261450 RepID=A0A835HTV8_9MAGN|nr:hypothetical protein IFM89_029474 [Coptis chinensis]